MSITLKNLTATISANAHAYMRTENYINRNMNLIDKFSMMNSSHLFEYS